MTKKKTKKRDVNLDVRPFPNPLFKNFDYTPDGPNKTSPGGGPYFGTPGGGEKSMGDWIKKRRQQAKKVAELAEKFAKLAEWQGLSITAGAKYYHGSPFSGINDDFSNFKGARGILFLSPTKDQALTYSGGQVLNSAKFSGERDPTIYTVDIDGANIFDLRNDAHKELYNKFLKMSRQSEDYDDWLPTYKNFHSGTGLPFYSIVPIIKPYIEDSFDGIWVSEAGLNTAIALFEPSKYARIVAREKLNDEA